MNICALCITIKISTLGFVSIKLLGRVPFSVVSVSFGTSTIHEDYQYFCDNKYHIFTRFSYGAQKFLYQADLYCYRNSCDAPGLVL